MTTQLAQLIDSVKAANGWSDPEIVSNAEKRGHNLTKSNISRYRNEEPLVSIKGSMIESLAAGLRVTTSQVAIAAVQSMGIALPSYDVPTIEQAIRLDIDLSARDRQVLLATLSGIRAQGATDDRPADQPARDDPPTARTRTPGTEDEKSRKPTSLSERRSRRQAEPEPLPEELPEDAWAARTRDPRFRPDIPEDDAVGEENQDQE